ncbi:flagellar hook-length control protein FliK [Methyloversatilis sp. MC4-4]|uniref:flagellar hook-length control protein FliK n=1 Tax=Methyloversatilis sp. MC4-4 TaxID=3132824 RepID=UPI003CF87799
MPAPTLNLPTSSTPLATSGPVGEIRGIAGELSGEDAAAFANLLKDNLQASGQGRELPPALLADLMADAIKPDEDAQELITTETPQSGADMLAAGLLMTPVLQLADALKTAASSESEATTALSDLTGGNGGKPAKGDAAPLAAGIAAQAGSEAEVDGKTLPDFDLAADVLPDAFADNTTGTMQQAQHADFRAHMAAAQQPKTEMTVATPVSQPGWADDVGHQISWLADQGMSKAELVLTPPHLGRIEITLEIGSDLSTAQFVSASPLVREALEQAMPRLREMLAEGGISLGEANVSSDQPSREGQGGEQRGQRGRDSGELAVSQTARRGTGLVDLFA